MNLRFWKKKLPDEDDKTADPNDSAKGEGKIPPPRPGWLARLRTILPARKKPPVQVDNESEPHVKEPRNKHEEEEVEVPIKLGMVARLKGILVKLLRSRKRKQPEAEQETAEAPSRTRTRHAETEEEGTPPTPAKSGKKKLLILALLIPLLAGIGFATWKWLPGGGKIKQETAPVTAPAPATEAAAPLADAPPASPEAPLQEGQPFSAPIAAATGSAQPAADASATTPQTGTTPPADFPADADVQAQIEALKKQNQEMQAQIDMLKQQQAGTASKPAKSGSSALPKDGVIIIGGKNSKESAQSLKKVIEEMNTSSDRSSPQNK
jgi:hypothetical protein